MPLIVFDMDGTLIDTHSLIAEHMASAFTGEGLAAPTPADVRRIIGLSLPVAVGKLAQSDDANVVSRIVTSYKALYRAAFDLADREPLFPGARAALDRLHPLPGHRLGIATGKGLSGVERILGNHGILSLFATLQTPDHNPSKPHPGMLLRAMEETGAGKGETIMVGDTVYDIETAKAAGVAAIGVAWGYHDPDELRVAGADAMIESYDELDGAIGRLLA